MGRPRMAVPEWNNKELDRQLKEQFIHGSNENDMLTEIICELTTMSNTIIVTSDQV